MLTYPFSSFLVLESDALGQPAYPDVKDYSRRELEEIIKNISKPEVLHGGELEVAAENGPLSEGEPCHLHPRHGRQHCDGDGVAGQPELCDEL